MTSVLTTHYSEEYQQQPELGNSAQRCDRGQRTAQYAQATTVAHPSKDTGSTVLQGAIEPIAIGMPSAPAYTSDILHTTAGPGPVVVKVRLLTATAQMPVRKHPDDSGADLIVDTQVPLRLMSHSIEGIHTGLAVEIPAGYEGQIRPRSSLASRGIIIPNSPGTIDACYRGELIVLLMNFSGRTYVIEPGDRIAQLVITPITLASFQRVPKLADSNRGTGGFGSTGR